MFPLIARTMFRVQEQMLGRRSFAILSDLEKSQWWPKEKIDDLRLRRLQALVQAAWKHSRYWQTTMREHGISPESIRDLSDLKRFPLLDKETVRASREDMVWRDEGVRLQLVRTSGSTNEALQFYTNSHREAEINAARMRGHRWVGIERGQREMYFWGSPVELNKQDRIKRLRDWLVNDGLTNGFALKPELVPQYVAHWKRWRPKCIFGYPCTLALMVTMAAAASIDLGSLRRRGLKMIVTTSEILSDVDRKSITDAFGVPVYDSYGLREGGLIAHECDRFTMHCMDEQVILETIDPDTLQPTDGEGELVLTNIVSRVMPMIRYRTGDIVTLSNQPCACGRNLGSIRISGGRIADFIVTDNGTWIPGYAFIYICRSVKGIVNFQLIQEHKGHVRVLLATDGDFPADGPRQVREAVRKRLQSSDEIAVELVDNIPPAPSGKYRPVIGRLGENLRKGGAATRHAASPTAAIPHATHETHSESCAADDSAALS
jgi:phenylacetate-CoA ligase